MPYYCTVPRCTSMAGKAKNVSFHQFPRDEELAKLWNKILKRGKPYTKYSKVCSLHFTPEDYTITSVGKNKGQWRTLRKDAIPSQNLPSESPTPYQRKQWSAWARDPPPNILDPTSLPSESPTPYQRKQWSAWARDPPPNILDPMIQQQMAQAIYMQTMLAMQAAGATDLSTLNHANSLPTVPTEAFAHTSTSTDTDILKGKQTNTHKSTSYKCTECSKCFKDPDVFILHKRTHIKNEKNEKENFNLNLTLQANPILANLLKTNTENSNIFDTNFSMESFLMTALAANMEGYMRNFTSMIKSEGNLGNDRDQLDQDRSHIDHNGEGVDQSRDDSPTRDLDNNRGDLDRNNDLDHANSSEQEHDSNQETELTDKGAQNDHKRIQNHQSTSHNSNNGFNFKSDKNDSDTFNGRLLEYYKNNKISNSSRCNENSVNSDGSSKNDDVNETITKNDCNNLNKTLQLGKNLMEQGMSIESYVRGIMDSNSSEMGLKDYVRDQMGLVGIDRAVLGLGRGGIGIGGAVLGLGGGVLGLDRGVIDDRYNVTNDDDDDSLSSSDGPICDKDLNESVDSNKLVIDETV